MGDIDGSGQPTVAIGAYAGPGEIFYLHPSRYIPHQGQNVGLKFPVGTSVGISSPAQVMSNGTMEAHPNPGYRQGLLRVSWNGQYSRLGLYDGLGQQVRLVELQSWQRQCDVATLGLVSGVYYLRLEDSQPCAVLPVVIE